MNGHPRKAGVIETRPRAVTPPRHTRVPLLESQLEDKWLIFDHAVYCVGTMLASDYEKMVRSHATSDYLKYILLRNIDTWDSWARWYTCSVLLQQKKCKITLYDSKQAAEQAMEGAG